MLQVNREDDLLQTITATATALPQAEARELMRALLAGRFTPDQIRTFLTALHHRPVTSAELAGFAAAMREAATTLPLTEAECDTLVDTCGTGGDGSGTFNISTGAALVASAAGATVAKHGNRSITSRCGSADVLEALGIRIDHTPDSAAEALRRHSFAFLLATQMHPAMRVVAPIRRTLPFRTIFNLLGPMTNPAGARRQVMGVYEAAAVPLVAKALAHGGHMHHALIVHGETANGTGMDELSLSGDSSVADVRRGLVGMLSMHPSDLGIAPSDDPLQGGDARQNAAILRAVFAADQTTPALRAARDIVVFNASAVLYVADISDDYHACKDVAEQAIDSGAVTRLVEALQA